MIQPLNITPMNYTITSQQTGPTFWKCWKSKFDLGNKCTEVDGCVDVHAIAEKFATYFEKKYYSCNNVKQKTTLQRI